MLKDAQANNGVRNVSTLVLDRPVFAAHLTEIHREGVAAPGRSLFRVSTLVLLSIFYNLVHVAFGMHGFAIFVDRDAVFFQSHGLVANTAGESRTIWPRCL